MGEINWAIAVLTFTRHSADFGALTLVSRGIGGYSRGLVDFAFWAVLIDVAEVVDEKPHKVVSFASTLRTKADDGHVSRNVFRRTNISHAA